MRIRFLANTNIRISPRDFSKPPVGVIFSGVELDVEDRLYRGLEVDGVNTYFRDNRGWYYWSGRAVILYKALEAPREDKAVEEPEVEPVGGSWKLPIEDSQRINENIQEEQQQTAPPEEERSMPAEGNREVPPRETRTPEQDIRSGEGIVSRQPVNMRVIEKLKIRELFWEKYRLTGKGVGVAILGSGIRMDNQDLESSIGDYRNFCTDRVIDVIDKSGQGTACASIIAGQRKQGIAGLAPESRLFIGKIMNHDLDIDYQRLIRAFQWTMQLPADLILINIDFRESSLTEDQKRELHQIVGLAAKYGKLCIAPVGDALTGKPENRYPACLYNCLSVGAHDIDNQRVESSLMSYTLDIVAPSEELLPESWPQASGQSFKNTVLAAAFSAGILALVKQIMTQQGIGLSTEQLMDLVRATAIPKDKSTKCRDVEYGCGMINPAGLLERILSL